MLIKAQLVFEVGCTAFFFFNVTYHASKKRRLTVEVEICADELSVLSMEGLGCKIFVFETVSISRRCKVKSTTTPVGTYVVVITDDEPGV